MKRKLFKKKGRKRKDTEKMESKRLNNMQKREEIKTDKCSSGVLLCQIYMLYTLKINNLRNQSQKVTKYKPMKI
jgi:hypothetical protein